MVHARVYILTYMKPVTLIKFRKQCLLLLFLMIYLLILSITSVISLYFAFDVIRNEVTTHSITKVNVSFLSQIGKRYQFACRWISYFPLLKWVAILKSYIL